MGFCDEASADDYERELSAGLVFLNWTNCRYSGNFCPGLIQKHREKGLLMNRCSNNDSIKECRMYQFLGMAIEKYDFLSEEYRVLMGGCAGASESVRENVSRFREEIGVVCAEIVGESL